MVLKRKENKDPWLRKFMCEFKPPTSFESELSEMHIRFLLCFRNFQLIQWLFYFDRFPQLGERSKHQFILSWSVDIGNCNRKFCRKK